MVKYDRKQRLKDMGGNTNPLRLRGNPSNQCLYARDNQVHRQSLYARDSQVHHIPLHTRDSQVHVGSHMHPV
jgi:hypothetical protein